MFIYEYVTKKQTRTQAPLTVVKLATRTTTPHNTRLDLTFLAQGDLIIRVSFMYSRRGLQALNGLSRAGTLELETSSPAPAPVFLVLDELSSWSGYESTHLHTYFGHSFRHVRMDSITRYGQVAPHSDYLRLLGCGLKQNINIQYQQHNCLRPKHLIPIPIMFVVH